jgi:hypothetical protein
MKNAKVILKLMASMYLVLFLIVSLSIPTVALEISEIMYNPIGEDNKYEFIELFAEELTNISSAEFEGITFKFPENYSFKGYLVLARSDEYFKDRYGLKVNFTFSGSLSNAGETITLTMPISSNYSENQSTNDAWMTILNVTYSDLSDPGYSLIFSQKQAFSSKILHGTPGRGENVTREAKEGKEKEEESNEGDDDGAEDNPECSEILEKLKLDFKINNTVLSPGQKLAFYPKIGLSKEMIFELDYWIENSKQETAKKLSTTRNLYKKTFTPKTGKTEVFFIKGRARVYCKGNEEYIKELNVSKSFVFLNDDPFLVLRSKNKPKFGSNLTIDIEGNLQNVLSIKLGNLTSLKIDTKKEYFNQVISLALPSDCVTKYPPRYYDLEISTDTKTILERVNIRSSRCPKPTHDLKELAQGVDINQQSKSFKNSSKISPTITDLGRVENTKKSNHNSSIPIAYYAFFGLSLVGNVILMWKDG